VELYRAFAESEGGDVGTALRILGDAVPAAGRLGTDFLARPTLKPLAANPRFEVLLRHHATDVAATAGPSR
jgi:hypothetical protein